LNGLRQGREVFVKFAAVVINLERATARLAAMDKQLAALGIEYDRFPALDGNARIAEFEPKVDQVSYESRMGQRLLPGKVGCYFSHLAVWEIAATSDTDATLIMEDDISFGRDFLLSLDHAKTTANRWDVLRLNATRAKFPICQHKTGPYKLNAYLGRFTGNGCYFVKRETARRMLPKIGRMRQAFEYEIGRFFEHDIRLLGLEPFPTTLDSTFDSQIVGRHDQLKTKLKGRKRAEFQFRKAQDYALRLKYLAARRFKLGQNGAGHV